MEDDIPYPTDNGKDKCWSTGTCRSKNRCWDNKEEDEDVQKDCLSKLCMDHEKASGGRVGEVLLDKGADANAPSVPSSRDTALSIAADNGDNRSVELLLPLVDVKNKKGNSLSLACNGGHLNTAHADIDSQDNRKVSSNQELSRYMSTVQDKVPVFSGIGRTREGTRLQDHLCALC